jgi:DNA polymerase-3 subunit epsilon
MMAGLNFVALDVETADSGFPESICQMGFAVVREGQIVETHTHTINTPHRFGWWQSAYLSITEDDVERAPPFSEVARTVSHLMAGPVFSHTSYDRFAVGRACANCGHTFADTVWLDSAQVVRRAWPERYGKTGYGLKSVAADLGIEFLHHDAGEDARVVAEIVIRASVEHSLDVTGWAERVRKPISGNAGAKADLRRDGNVDGALYGEVVVLTGGFDLPKAEQANLAAYAGCEIGASVTKKTTLVVVGDDRYARGERSGKWRRAEELAHQGLPIRIMSESDFRELIAD